jgi:hypothetical protein
MHVPSQAGVMNVRNRQRLLAFASWLDRCAARVRKYVASVTPKRPRKTQEQT